MGGRKSRGGWGSQEPGDDLPAVTAYARAKAVQSPSQCVCAPIPLPPTSQLLDAGPGGEAPGGEAAAPSDDAAPGGGPDAKEPEEGAAPLAEAGLGKENPPPKRVR